MSILAWAVLGIIAGAIAKAIYPGTQGGGILGTMVLGIIGAFVGGALHSFLTTGSLAFGASLSVGGVVIAVLGAIVALFLYYAVARRTV